MLPEPTPAHAQALLLFQVGPVYCCAPTDPVQAVVLPPRMHRPAGIGAGEPGVFEHGEQIVKVVDLRQRFGIDPQHIKQGGRVVIVENSGDAFGLWVDEVLDVIIFPSEGWGHAPALIPRKIFARTLLLDERVFLYTQFHDLTALQAGAGLRAYVQRLAEEQARCRLSAPRPARAVPQSPTQPIGPQAAVSPPAQPGAARRGAAATRSPQPGSERAPRTPVDANQTTASEPEPEQTALRNARSHKPLRVECQPVGGTPGPSAPPVPSRQPAATERTRLETAPTDKPVAASTPRASTATRSAPAEQRSSAAPRTDVRRPRMNAASKLDAAADRAPRTVPATPDQAQPAAARESGDEEQSGSVWMLAGVALLVIVAAGLSYQLLLPEAAKPAHMWPTPSAPIVPPSASTQTQSAPLTETRTEAAPMLSDAGPASVTTVDDSATTEAPASTVAEDAALQPATGGSLWGNDDGDAATQAPAASAEADSAAGEVSADAWPSTGSGRWGNDDSDAASETPVAGAETDSAAGEVSAEAWPSTGTGLWGNDDGDAATQAPAASAAEADSAAGEVSADAWPSTGSELWGNDGSDPSADAPSQDNNASVASQAADQSTAIEAVDDAWIAARTDRTAHEDGETSTAPVDSAEAGWDATVEVATAEFPAPADEEAMSAVSGDVGPEGESSASVSSDPAEIDALGVAGAMAVGAEATAASGPATTRLDDVSLNNSAGRENSATAVDPDANSANQAADGAPNELDGNLGAAHAPLDAQAGAPIELAEMSANNVETAAGVEPSTPLPGMIETDASVSPDQDTVFAEPESEAMRANDVAASTPSVAGLEAETATTPAVSHDPTTIASDVRPAANGDDALDADNRLDTPVPTTVSNGVLTELPSDNDTETPNTQPSGLVAEMSAESGVTEVVTVAGLVEQSLSGDTGEPRPARDPDPAQLTAEGLHQSIEIDTTDVGEQRKPAPASSVEAENVAAAAASDPTREPDALGTVAESLTGAGTVRGPASTETRSAVDASTDAGLPAADAEQRPVSDTYLEDATLAPLDVALPDPALIDHSEPGATFVDFTDGFRASIERDERGVIITLHDPAPRAEMAPADGAPTASEQTPPEETKAPQPPAESGGEAAATVAASAPQSRVEPPARRRLTITHVVVKGDTLWHIAERYVDNPFRYPELARLSNISDPDWIYPGDLVRIVKYVDASASDGVDGRL